VAKGNAISNDLSKVVDRLVKEQFPGAVLEEVKFDMDQDADGDPILRIVLVFESAGSLDPAAAAGFARHLRPKLKGDAFPLIRFMNVSDYRKQQSAAA
jgi:hypothetical protein